MSNRANMNETINPKEWMLRYEHVYFYIETNDLNNLENLVSIFWWSNMYIDMYSWFICSIH